jgi:PAS domain S-box-containing protein
MMSTAIRVLILETRAADAELMLHELRRAGFDPVWQRAETESDYVALLEPGLDIVLADYSLPQFDTLRAMLLLQERGLDVPFIVVTGAVSEEAAVECMKKGAADYILKDCLARLGQAVKRALEDRQIRLERKQAEEARRISEERLKTFLNTTSDLVFLKDSEYRHIFANRALAQYLGKSIEEVIGKTDYDLLPAQAAENCHRSDKKAQTEEQVITTEEIVRGRHFETIKFVVPLGDGRQGIGGFIREVTERKQAEAALRASEERFRIAAQSVSDVVWQWNIESARLDWYGEIDALLGYASGQFPRTIEAWERIIHPDDHDRVMAALEAHFNDGRPYREEYRVLGKDGSIAHWRDIGTALRDDRGKAYQMVGAIADITKQKQAEEQLRRSEAALKKAQQVSHVGSWIWDIPANRLEWSDEMFRIFGVEKKNFAGDLNEVIERAIHPDDRAAVERANLSVVKDKTPLALEYRVVWPDGTVRTVWAEAGGLTLDEAGQPQVLTGIVQDITERKKAEAALRENEEKYRGLVEQSLMGIGISHENRVIFANPALLDIFGYDDLEEFIKVPLLDHVAAASRENIATRMAKAAKGELLPADFEYDILRKDGKTRKLHCLPTHFTLSGEIYTQTVFQDITERKKAEEDLKRSEIQYRSLTENSPDLIARFDRQYRHLYVNPAAAKAGRYLPDEYIGKTMAEVGVPEEEARKWEERIRTVFETGQVVDVEDSFETPSGSRDFHTKFVPEFAPDGLIHSVQSIARDIAERKQAAQALQESEERYRTLVENANDAIVLAQDGLLKFANQRTSEMTGYSRQEMVGKPFVKFIHPDDRQMVSGNYARRIRGEQVPEVYTFRIVGKSGKETWVEIHAVLIQWQDRPATLNFLSDITERRRAEEALQKSEHMLKMTLNSLRDAVFILDAQTTNIEECNFIASEIFGYKRSELVGRSTEFLHVDKPALEDFRKKLYAAVEEKGFLHNFEFHMKRRDGKVFPTEHSVLPLRDEKHALTGWVSVVSDITERKQAEDRIQSLMREVEFILGATKTTLDIVDSKCNLRFVDPASNKARGDWPGRKCYDYFMGRRSPCPNCGMSQALRTKEMVVTEVALLKEGQRFVQIISIPFQDEKGEWLVAEVSVDITERKRTEEALLASREELRSLSTRLQSLREEERTTLAREIHDELGQALTALNMDLSWLSTKLPKSQPPLLKKVESMSAVVAATMQTVKRLSSELRPGLLDDLGLVTAMQWQAEEFGKRTWLKMKITFVPEEMTVERDLSTAIFRIFQELLTNIARHAKATRVEVSLKRKAGALELRVKDNGRGIRKSEIANSRSLGLIGIRERVLAFGGRVEIVGIPRRGTRIVVRLPERGKRDDKNPGG